MTKRKLIQKTFPGIIILFLLFSYLDSCKKEDQNNNNINVFQINLADTSYHRMLHTGVYVLFSEYNIIVAYSPGGYTAADSQCPVCGYTIGYRFLDGTYPWGCGKCGAQWGGSGTANWLTAKALKIHTVTKSGNILTIQL